jgi:hypothetical protein
LTRRRWLSGLVAFVCLSMIVRSRLIIERTHNIGPRVLASLDSKRLAEWSTKPPSSARTAGVSQDSLVCVGVASSRLTNSIPGRLRGGVGCWVSMVRSGCGRRFFPPWQGVEVGEAGVDADGAVAGRLERASGGAVRDLEGVADVEGARQILRGVTLS